MPRLPEPISEEAMREAAEGVVAAEEARRGEASRAYEDLLASLWLYIPWRFVTSQLTTPQKELLADAIDASHARADAEDPDLDAYAVDRWWQDG